MQNTKKKFPVDAEGYFDSVIGTLHIEAFQGEIVSIRFLSGASIEVNVTPSDPVIALCCAQLADYFDGNRTNFDFPIALRGTPFQRLAWEEMRKIPYGTTISYKDFALKAGFPLACRAYAAAASHNPIAIVVPCHRLIASKGKLGGYAYGLAAKSSLLNLEKRLGQLSIF